MARSTSQKNKYLIVAPSAAHAAEGSSGTGVHSSEVSRLEGILRHSRTSSSTPESQPAVAQNVTSCNARYGFGTPFVPQAKRRIGVSDCSKAV